MQFVRTHELTTVRCRHHDTASHVRYECEASGGSDATVGKGEECNEQLKEGCVFFFESVDH